MTETQRYWLVYQHKPHVCNVSRFSKRTRHPTPAAMARCAFTYSRRTDSEVRPWHT